MLSRDSFQKGSETRDMAWAVSFWTARHHHGHPYFFIVTASSSTRALGALQCVLGGGGHSLRFLGWEGLSSLKRVCGGWDATAGGSGLAFDSCFFRLWLLVPGCLAGGDDDG